MYSPADRPSQDARRAGEEPELVDARRELLGHGHPHRLAGVAALRGDDLVGARLHRVGDPQQGQAPLRRRGVAPGLEAPAAARSAASTSAVAGDRGLRVRLPGARVDDLARAAARGVDVLAVTKFCKTSQGVTASTLAAHSNRV